MGRSETGIKRGRGRWKRSEAYEELARGCNERRKKRMERKTVGRGDDGIGRGENEEGKEEVAK